MLPTCGFSGLGLGGSSDLLNDGLQGGASLSTKQFFVIFALFSMGLRVLFCLP